MLTAMGRAERLLDLAELLRASEGTTVLALATELGVSERTLLRDLATLRERGMPITGEPGPGGGVRLESDRGVTAVHLSLAEAASIWLAARLSREASDLPWGEAARSALAKLLGSLPRHKARELRALCRRVYVGPAASAATTRGQRWVVVGWVGGMASIPQTVANPDDGFDRVAQGAQLAS